jgi:hypothetical protein
LSLDEARRRVADMAADIFALLPGIGYETVTHFGWEELLFWHGKAVSAAKRLRGIV